MPLPLILTGAAIGSNLLSGYLSSRRAERERQRRQEALRRFIARLRGESLAEAYKLGSGLIAESRSAAFRRAQSLGRAGEAESFILPAQERAQRQTSDLISRITEAYRRAELGTELEFEGRPIEPSFLDYLSTGLSGAAQFAQTNELISALGDRTTPKTETEEKSLFQTPTIPELSRGIDVNELPLRSINEPFLYDYEGSIPEGGLTPRGFARVPRGTSSRQGLFNLFPRRRTKLSTYF